MGTQQQIQLPQNQQGSKRTSKVRVIIAIIVVLSIIVGVTIATLNVLGIIHIPLPTPWLLVLTVVVIPVLSVALGPLMTFFQWLFPFSSDKPQQLL
jgi:membrane protein YdbS with pleckstrin-like domain